MRDPSFYVSGLLDLHKLADAAERRATWRQSMAALARAAVEEGPGPLAGLHPDALVQGVRAAIAQGLVDDLDWLAPPAAGAALYELAAALPLGVEQRDLGRRVLARVLSGNAETFVALATRMALGASKGLSSGSVRARVALTFELPLSIGVPDGPLALALASRRDLAREWIGAPSTGSLPARRLAARLLERAAREAARRALQGDPHAMRVFRGDAVADAYRRLLSDRESLVWRHVAVARGLLAPWVGSLHAEIQTALDPELTPTEWRRAAASIAAMLAVAPDEAMRIAQVSLTQGMLQRDPGAAVAFAWGIPRAAEVEPELSGELLDWLVDRAPSEVSEAIVELRMEYGSAPFVDRASARALLAIGRRSRVPPSEAQADDGKDALNLEIARDLERSPRDDQPIREQLARALQAFAHDGARAAYAVAREVLESAKGAMDALAAVTPEDDAGGDRAGALARRTSMAVLRDLDVSLLERDVLADLLRLAPSGGDLRAHEETLDSIRERLESWILAREGTPLRPAPGASAPLHPTLALRRLRALLHLVDGDVGEVHDDGSRDARLRKRLVRVAHALLVRFEADPPSVVRRTCLAALARALDALVRVGACDVSDVVLVASRRVEDPGELETLAEASMDPDLEHILERFAAFARTVRPQLQMVVGDADVASEQSPPAGNAHKLQGLAELTRELSPDGSARTEALRTVLVRLHAALEGVDGAPSLRALAGGSVTEPEVVASFEGALGALAQLTVGARTRLEPDRDVAAALPAAGRPLTVAVSRVLSGAESQLADHVVAACLDELIPLVPRAIGRVAASVAWSLVEKPLDRPSVESARVRVADGALPNWVPARRTIGGFYVLRPLSSGAVGSVFVVTRVEDRHDPGAERFALKVPEYNETAARSVSEADFMKMFREEASALIGLPVHPNLARFVTFDAGARPKPILVMELVEGMTFERVIESASLDVPRVLRTLDQVLAGLETMHGVGVGHLDIKPSNIVLRRNEEAVLVDFGLAGRHIRPGCATGAYGAPEVWGIDPSSHSPGSPARQVEVRPMPADIYAFGCMAYEALTGALLFDGENEMALIARHVGHDGFPPGVRELAQRPALAPVAEFLFSALRRDPRDRASAGSLRAELRKLTPQLSRLRWPLRAA